MCEKVFVICINLILSGNAISLEAAEEMFRPANLRIKTLDIFVVFHSAVKLGYWYQVSCPLVR